MSDNVIQFAPLPVLKQTPLLTTNESEGLSPWKTRSKREEASLIIKAAAAYCCHQSTCAPGFIADHTCDGVFAGYGGIVGDKHMMAADRSMRKLVKLMDKATAVLTVELWSLASVARFVMKQTDDGEAFEGEEAAFVKSFAGLIKRLSAAQYHREIGQVQHDQ
jgi:hypothetical protein